MFERFTKTARETVVRAQAEARTLRDPRTGTEHLLLALLDDRASTAYRVLCGLGLRAEDVRDAVRRGEAGLVRQQDAEALRSIGIDVDAVLARLTETFGEDAVRAVLREQGTPRRSPSRHIPFSQAARDAMGSAVREAIRLGDKHIDDGHILAGVLSSGGAARGLVQAQGVSAEQVRTALERAWRKSA